MRDGKGKGMGKIKKYIYYFTRALKRMRYFPWRISLLDILNKTLSIIHVYNLYLLKKMDKAIIDFIETKYGDLINGYACVPHPPRSLDYSGTIWLCWWQGEEHAPKLVQKCIESIRRNAGNHPVVVITWENLSQYVELPEHILALARSGKISLTHLSDVLRVKLLAVHGGLWLDSTMFYVTQLDERLWGEPFFSPGATMSKKGVNFDSRSEDVFWCICLLMAKKAHPVFLCLSEFYYQFYSEYSMEVHYFMTDYVFSVIVKRLGTLDKLPSYAMEKHAYVRMFDKAAGRKAYEDIPIANFFQFTYKVRWPEYTTAGKKTAYGALVD